MRQKEIPIDESDSESEYSYDDDSSVSEEIVLKKKPKSRVKSNRNKPPTIAELKMMEKMERIEKFVTELAKAKQKKKVNRSNKTVVVYPPPSTQQPVMTEKERRDFIGMF